VRLLQNEIFGRKSEVLPTVKPCRGSGGRCKKNE
jgi:hypothetical protein